MSPRKKHPAINPRHVIDDLPDMLAMRLRVSGGGKYNDPDYEDVTVVKAMLECGLDIEQVCATFIVSPRGRHAMNRTGDGFDVYLRRTIRMALEKLELNGWRRR